MLIEALDFRLRSVLDFDEHFIGHQFFIVSEGMRFVLFQTVPLPIKMK